MNLIRLLVPTTLHVPSLRRSLLAWVMHLANQAPNGDWFNLKAELLAIYGENDGYDLQDVRKGCWPCCGTGQIEIFTCSKCHGTGTHSRSYNILYRRKVEGWLFHVPDRLPGLVAFDRLRPLAHSVTDKVKVYRNQRLKLASEVTLWLLLLNGSYAWFGRALRASCFSNPRLHPLLCLQWLVFQICMLKYTVYDWRHICALAWTGFATRLAFRIYPSQLPPCRCHDGGDILHTARAVAEEFNVPSYRMGVDLAHQPAVGGDLPF